MCFGGHFLGDLARRSERQPTHEQCPTRDAHPGPSKLHRSSPLSASRWLEATVTDCNLLASHPREPSVSPRRPRCASVRTHLHRHGPPSTTGFRGVSSSNVCLLAPPTLHLG
ncbi:Hypothetical protein CAP_7311 [Chondromyces apiculatus DSM 436]|uniref:Uncharacterized protein n=1 Tax=Chondromyces apiculatus DSM 436 TaxID=1192034 RepID=A0A017SZ21_9BACT|nr:Hypothetical protein CAP_7311 [Chondromyces apiculatus DSM 436]